MKSLEIRLIAGGALFAFGLILHYMMDADTLVQLAVFGTSYLIVGYNVVYSAGRNIVKGNVLDENFLMALASIGAFFTGSFTEAVGVMLFYRVGEYFEDRAVARSRSQIMEAVDLRPEVVQLVDGETVREIPAGEANIGDIVLVRPGDRILSLIHI